MFANRRRYAIKVIVNVYFGYLFGWINWFSKIYYQISVIHLNKLVDMLDSKFLKL